MGMYVNIKLSLVFSAVGANAVYTQNRGSIVNVDPFRLTWNKACRAHKILISKRYSGNLFNSDTSW